MQIDLDSYVRRWVGAEINLILCPYKLGVLYIEACIGFDTLLLALLLHG